MSDSSADIPPAHLRALTKRIEQMREQERTRIARELHDELGQLLTGIKLDFSATIRRLREHKVDGEVVDRLQSATGQIDLAITVVRRIATDLRPAQLDHRDLGGAIEEEARRVAARAGLDIQLANRLNDRIEPGPAAATAAFRIFQEALTNAVRHAGATAITARLSHSRGRLFLYVRDNGSGAPERVLEGAGSIGLLGMRERARSIGGTLRIATRAGRGTLVFVTLPMNAR